MNPRPMKAETLARRSAERAAARPAYRADLLERLEAAGYHENAAELRAQYAADDAGAK